MTSVYFKNRLDVVSLLFENSPLFLTPQQFQDSLDGWALDPVTRADGSIGAVFVSKGPEFHFQKFGSDVQCTRKHLQKYPGSLIADYGYALTKTPKSDTRQQRFNERLGFYKVGEDEFDLHYRIDNLRKRTPPCQ